MACTIEPAQAGVSARGAFSTCAACRTSGAASLDLDAIEAYHFGCWDEPGHGWHQRDNDYIPQRDVVRRVGPEIHPRIDGGFCPGAPAPSDRLQRPTRSQVQGEAALHHLAGWTVLALWDRSVDTRGGSNAAFVALGTHDFTTMCAIAEAQFPTPWARVRGKLVLVEDAR